MLKVIGNDIVTESLVIRKILISLFRICALSDITQYHARTVERPHETSAAIEVWESITTSQKPNQTFKVS